MIVKSKTTTTNTLNWLFNSAMSSCESHDILTGEYTIASSTPLQNTLIICVVVSCEHSSNPIISDISI